MLNYNPQANTEDFSCIAFIYGCMDSLALNFDSLANTDNGSCIEVVVGCMDPGAYNYEPVANVSDSLSCLYALLPYAARNQTRRRRRTIR